MALPDKTQFDDRIPVSFGSLPVRAPELPEDVLRRFPSLAEWQTSNNRMLSRMRESITSAGADLAIPLNQLNQETENIRAYAQSVDSSLTARITSEESARIAEDSALASLITTVEANYQAADLSLSASITDEQTARVNADSALASRATTLEAQMANTAGSGLQTRIATEESARVSADEALSTRTTALESQVNHGTTGLTATYARLLTEETTRASADAALSTRASTLESQVQTPTTGLLARVSVIETTYATDSEVGASISSALVTAANDAQARVNTEASARIAADGAIHARWGVAIDVNGRVVGRVNLDGTNQSGEFKVSVDKFVVENANGTLTAMDIRPGGGIVFGSDIQSDNYSPGVSGWRLTRNGLLDAHSGTFRGGLLLGTNSTTPGYSGDTNFGFVVEPGTNALFISRDDVFALSLNRGTSDGSVAIFHKNAAQVGEIAVTNTSTSYVTSSDARLKSLVTPVSSAFDGLIDSIAIREFEFTNDPGHRMVGVLAQELHAVFPDAVVPGDAGLTVSKSWGVDYSKLVPLLVHEVQRLRARIAALESP